MFSIFWTNKKETTKFIGWSGRFSENQKHQAETEHPQDISYDFILFFGPTLFSLGKSPLNNTLDLCIVLKGAAMVRP